MIEAARNSADVDAAAQIWAEATAAQLTYLGVHPGLWGQGIAERLLRELRLHLQAASFTRAQLSVYAGNRRATALYERLGWHRVGQPTPHPRTGKPEQRYELIL